MPQKMSEMCNPSYIENDVESDHIPQTIELRTGPVHTQHIFVRYDISRIDWNHFNFFIRMKLGGIDSLRISKPKDIDNLDNKLRCLLLSYLENYGKRKNLLQQENMIIGVEERSLRQEKNKLENKLRRCWDFFDSQELKVQIKLIKRKIIDVVKKNEEKIWKRECSKLHRQNPKFWKLFARMVSPSNEKEEISLKSDDGFTIPKEEIPDILHRRGSFKDHIKTRREKATGMLKFLTRFHLEPETFLFVYSTCIEPFLIYGYQGWYRSEESSIFVKKLEKTRRFAIKLAFGSDLNSKIENAYDVKRFTKSIHKRAINDLKFNKQKILGINPNYGRSSRFSKLRYSSIDSEIIIWIDYMEFIGVCLNEEIILSEAAKFAALNGLSEFKSISKHLPTSHTQHGFKPLHSTTTHLTTLSQFVLDGFNVKRPPKRTVLASIDISKAFDSVPRCGLTKKILTTGLDSNYKSWLANFLSGRMGYVSLMDHCSKQRYLPNGVPQGSVLSPSLFNLYLHDFPANDPNNLTLSYADDIIIASKHEDYKAASFNLQQQLHSVENWL
ncbi:uncharacterized protein LOC115231815 [Octopus sinensis]|uniref:Uncharacterized protein LOC115231815 n=1 Tax=Octopus sinensis TaxID=2607531 RepID=A0A6P7U0T3_9MOLL|nr:uncharacterized protein LOC115231815 [Octopus sinensis]